MKKIYIILIIGLVFASCDDFDFEDQGFDLEALPGYVAFANDGGTITAPEEDVDEGDGSESFRIESPTGTLSDITVTFSFGGSAVYGTDFTVTGSSAAGGTIVLENNISEVDDYNFVDLEVDILTDAVADGDKTLTIELTGAVDGDGNQVAVGRGDYMKIATLNIEDLPLTAGFSKGSISTLENNYVSSGDTTYVTIELNYATPSDVTANITATGNLTDGVDFNSTNYGASMVVPAGEESISFYLINVDDNLKRALEADSIIYSISSVSIAGAGESVALDDADTLIYYVSDEVKELDVEDVVMNFTKVDEAGYYNIPVNLSLASDQTVSITYSITGGTAGVDYVDITGGTVNFAAGQETANITIQIPSSALPVAAEVNMDISLNSGGLTTTDAEISVGTTSVAEINLLVP